MAPRKLAVIAACVFVPACGQSPAIDLEEPLPWGEVELRLFTYSDGSQQFAATAHLHEANVPRMSPQDGCRRDAFVDYGEPASCPLGIDEIVLRSTTSTQVITLSPISPCTFGARVDWTLPDAHGAEYFVEIYGAGASGDSSDTKLRAPDWTPVDPPQEAYDLLTISRGRDLKMRRTNEGDAAPTYGVICFYDVPAGPPDVTVCCVDRSPTAVTVPAATIDEIDPNGLLVHAVVSTNRWTVSNSMVWFATGLNVRVGLYEVP